MTFMKKLALENFGVLELNEKETQEIVGGSWFSRNWKTIGMIATAVAAATLYLIEEVF